MIQPNNPPPLPVGVTQYHCRFTLIPLASPHATAEYFIICHFDIPHGAMPKLWD
jgi:hypothetical protein